MKQLFFSLVSIFLGIISANSQVCDPIDYLGQNFENIPIDELPDCWSSIIRGDNVSEYATVGVSTMFPYSGLKSAQLYNDGSSFDSDIILVTPQLSNLNTHRLKFQLRGFLGTALQVGTLNGNGADATFTFFENAEIAIGYSEIIIDFAAYTGTDTYIGFRFNGPDPYNAVFLDNIQWEINPSCTDVTNIIIDQTTTESVTLTWDEASDQNNWQIVYAESSDVNPNTLTPVLEATTAATKTIIGLEDNTTYHAWVRSVCTEGVGAWIGPITFNTQCFPTTGFSESFENSNKPLLPECWSSIVRGFSNSNPDVYVTDNEPYEGENHVEIYNNEAIGQAVDLILISPKLTTLSTATHRVKFFIKGNTNVEVGTLDSNSITSTFTSFQDVVVTDDYTEAMVDFTFYDGEDSFIGIRMLANNNYSSVFIDNIRWELAPPCEDVTDIIVPLTTSTTAEINWISGADAFDLVFAPETVIDPSALVPVVPSPTESFTVLTDLTPNSSYNVWVRSICNEGVGAWIGPLKFQTPCNPTTAISENFDEVTTPNLPGCWTKILRGATLDQGTTITTDSSSSKSAPNAVTFSSSGSDSSNDIILVSPNLSNIGAGTHRLKFYAKAQGMEGALGSFQIGTLDTNTNSGVFTLFENVPLTSTFDEYIVDFTSFSGTDNFIAFRMNAGIYNMAFIDNVRWEVIPPCEDVIEVAVTDATTETAVVNWTTDLGFPQIVYGPLSVTDPNTLTPQTATADQFEISGLEGSTYYKVWVRSVCGEGVGAWIGPVVFTTACVPVASFNENFDNSSTFRNCWTKILRGPSITPFSAIDILGMGANSAPNMIYLAPVFANYETDDVILVSPNLTNLSAGTHQLRFYAQNTGSFSIGTLNNNDNSAIFTPFEDVIVVPGWNEYTVDFSTYTGTDSYIGFRVTSTENILTTVNLDNVVWEPALKVVDFNNASFSYYPNPVQDILNLSYSKNIERVEIFNLLGQKVSQYKMNTASVKIDMSNLPVGNYIVKASTDDTIKTIKILKQ